MSSRFGFAIQISRRPAITTKTTFSQNITIGAVLYISSENQMDGEEKLPAHDEFEPRQKSSGSNSPNIIGDHNSVVVNSVTAPEHLPDLKILFYELAILPWRDNP